MADIDVSMLPMELDSPEPLVDSWQGMTGARAFLTEWKDKFDKTPRKGDAYPGEPSIRCARKEAHGEGAGILGTDNFPHAYARVICYYSEYSYLDNDWKWYSQSASKLLNIGVGRWWADTGEYCDQQIDVIQSMIQYRVRRVMTHDPGIACASKYTCVNWSPWITPNGPVFDTETCLFTGADIDPWWDRERRTMLYGVTFNFLSRPYPWNVEWAEPRAVIDDFGNVTGYNGAGRWARPMPRPYALADLAGMMDLPPTQKPIVFDWAAAAADGIGGEFRKS